MPNGDGLAEGFSAAGNTHINGSLPPTAPPQCTSSPVNSQIQEPSPGAAAYPSMMLEKSEGASAGVTFHTGDSLQSLRLSMPMQETELCKHKLMWSECPLYAPLYLNLILLWDVLLFWLMYSSVFFNSFVCVLSEQKDSVGMSFSCLPAFLQHTQAFDCLIRIWCGCFIWNIIWTNGCVLELIPPACYLFGGILKSGTVALFTVMKCNIFRLGTNCGDFVWLHIVTPTQNICSAT